MSTTVHVENISAQTSEKEVRDFFSFCGKITSLSVTPTSDAAEASKSATVTFEKETAAKTALLLDSTQLGPSQVKVTTTHTFDDLTPEHGEAKGDVSDIEQEDKPRSRIVAEYLAHGYVIGDSAIQRAIELDTKHGVSAKFTNALQNFDGKYHATEKAKGIDSSYGVTEKAQSGWRGLNSYFEKAAATPTGQKLVNFYTQTSKQVLDVHAEARRLADLKKKEAGGTHEAAEKTTCKCGSTAANCPCPPGKCACANCAKSEVQKVPGTEKTKCQCGGKEGDCPCAEGKCACEGCSK